MVYRTIAYMAHGDLERDAHPLAKLRAAFPGAAINILYVGARHVTGFGGVTAHNHIANDMQVRQELYPVLKDLCDAQGLPHSNIHICLGEAPQIIERFVVEHQVELLAVGDGASAAHSSPSLKALLELLASCGCDLYVMH